MKPMKPERWQQIERLYDSALKLEPGARERFLKEACAGDESLRNKVASWLASNENAGSFLESPALDVLAKKLALDQPREPPQDIAGTTLVHYRIQEEIGEGGMGRVYRAEDTNLSRQVAIKVLPDEFAQDAERLARFEREAKLLAWLNHPNIASIYGLEQADGKPFLVLELVEGQTLAERLKKGRIPLDETLDICRQVAEGLEAAHQKGIIHRDLKPANVKVTPEGKVKILDFGLAKAFYDQAAPVDPSRSPAITDQMNAPGAILGTVAYMSPEQARGKPVDRRADIWAFGCVLYECLTGTRAFPGETIAESIAKILGSEPDWTILPAENPPFVRAVLRQCLQKDPSLRLHDIADARVEMREELAEPPIVIPVARRFTLGWIISAGAAILLIGILIGPSVMVYFRPAASPTSQPVVRATIRLEPGHWLDGLRRSPPAGFDHPTRTAMVISSDGRFVIYSAVKENPGPEDEPRLYLRRLDQTVAKPIAGTERGRSPFLSPDDRWVGFQADDKLMKLPVDGGVPTPLCDSGQFFGASWGADNQIVFARPEESGLSRISADGGKPEVLTQPKRSNEESGHRLPFCLPAGKGILFTITRDSWDLRPRVAVIDLSTHKQRVLLEDAADARYVGSGHMVFLRRGTLMAAPFDLNKLELTGQPVSVVGSVMQALNIGHSDYDSAAGQFSTSASGSLIYASGGILPDMHNSLVWVDHKGKAEPITSVTAPYYGPRLSPDGAMITYSTWGLEKQIYVHALSKGIATKITSEGKAHTAMWTPDGRRVVFSWWGAMPANIYWQTADGSSAMERLTTSENSQWAASLSPDGETLAFLEDNPDSGIDIMLRHMHDRKITPFLNSRFDERWPEFSPDGRFIAYASDESGDYEVYVRPFPGPGGKTQVSNDGGAEPMWSRDGKQLFYRRPHRRPTQVWVVGLQTGSGFSAGKPRLLFEQAVYRGSNPIRSWDISLDGQKFLMVKLQERKSQPVTEMILVQNWFEELKRLAPTGKK